jgi:replicative DNA helicase
MLAAGSKGFYITTEMTTREVEDRIHDIHIGKVVTAKTGFTHLDLETAMISAAGISKHHWLYHSSALTYSKIKRAINKYRDYNNGVDFVIIDSLNRMSYGKYDDEWRMVEEVTQALKNLAMDMNMVVIQLVQPGEANLKEKNKRITLATMGGSRKVRQESNFIFTLYRGAYIDNQLGESVCGKFENLTELIIPKAREFKPKGVVFESAGIKLEEAMAGTVADYRKYLME